MKRYIREMLNDLVRTYPGMDKDKAEKAIMTFERGLITKTELLRVIVYLAEDAR